MQEINAPVYSVNGNHDEQYPGPPIQNLLRHALKVNNVIDIEGQIVEFEEFRLIGVGDLWAGKADMRFMPHLPQDKPWVILSHNPDTVDMIPALPSRPLMLSGHTHGGQVELPWLTDYVMKKVSILGHKKGLYRHQQPRISTAELRHHSSLVSEGRMCLSRLEQVWWVCRFVFAYHRRSILLN